MLGMGRVTCAGAGDAHFSARNKRATGRTLNEAEQEQFRSIQLPAVRWTYIGSALTHPNFLATVGDFSPGGRKQFEELAPVFS